MLDVHGIEVDVQLFGKQCRQRRMHALPHLGTRRDQSNAVGVDAYVRCQRGLAGLEALEQRIVVRRLVAPVAKHNTAGDGGRTDQEGPARDFPRAPHQSDSPRK